MTIDERARALIAAFEGEAAFHARNLTTGDEFAYRPERVMPTASTIKLLVLAELFRQAEVGALRLDDPLPMSPDDREGGSGILKDLAPDVLLSHRDHATLMVALSDNTSTAALVRVLGRQRILASAAEWGMADTSFGFREPGDGARAYAAAPPRDITRLLQLIADDAILSPAACAAMRDILVTQQFHDQLARFLPFNQYEREGPVHRGPVIVRSKSGFMTDTGGAVRVDAGIVETPAARWVICCMNEANPERSYSPDNPGAVLNGRLSKLVYDAWGATGGATGR